MRIEGVDRRLVCAPRHPAENVGRGFARRFQLAFHAAADVEQHGNADTGDIGAEVGDATRTAAIEDLEIVDLEIPDETPLLVAHHRRDPNHIDARLEGSDRRRLILSPQAPGDS